MKVANRNLESVVDIFRYKTDKCADGKDLFLCFCVSRLVSRKRGIVTSEDDDD